MKKKENIGLFGGYIAVFKVKTRNIDGVSSLLFGDIVCLGPALETSTEK